MKTELSFFTEPCTRVIDGRAAADYLLASIRHRVQQQGLKPGLAVILVGSDPASSVYVRNKGRQAEACGFLSRQFDLPEETGEAALMANSSVLGMLIPPSAIMILYAWIGNQSVLAAFLATVVPGIILTLLLCVVNVFLLRNNTDLVLKEPMDRKTFQQLLARRSTRAIPALAMPFLILGGIYGGFVTPTEAAALGVIYAIPVGFFIYKGLDRRSLMKTLLEAAVTTGVIMVMLYSVMILSRLYIMEDLPGTIMGGLTSITDNPLLILMMINLFMVIIGMLMDDASAVLLSTPILLPLVTQLHVSPVQFAAIVGVNLGMGNITPPTAPLLYLGGQLNGARINQMMKPTLCMIAFAWIPTLLLVTYVPSLSLWLPHLVLGIQ